MIKQEPVNEMINELISVEADIKALNARIAKGFPCEEMLATNKKYLRMAMICRDSINQMLELEYSEGITNAELDKDLQRV